jgi:quercetin dioxygenase-like cupin family protein
MHHLHRITRTAAGALIASSLLTAPALATPGSNVVVSLVVNGQFGTIHENTAGNKTDKWGMTLKTLDDTDVGADRLTVQPGGHTGWHSHPSPVFVTVLQGSIEWVDGLLCQPRTVSAGQSLIESAGRVHNVRNSGGQAAEFIAIRIKPTSVVGPAFRIDEPEPNNCSF